MDIKNDFGISVNFHELEYYQKLVENKIPFTFTCWGDGEWKCAMKDPGQTKSGQIFYPELAEDLHQIITNKPLNYFHATDDFSFEILGDRISNYLKTNKFDVEWHNWRTFRYATEDSSIYKFIRATKKLSTVLVGPQYLQHTHLIRWDGFVPTPECNSYLEKHRIETDILSVIKDLPKPVVIFFSIGLAAPVIQNNLFGKIGHDCYMIDFGSIFDGLIGLKKRIWHSKIQKKIPL